MGGNISGGTLATALSTVDGSVPLADVIASQKSWALSPSAYHPGLLMLHVLIESLVKAKEVPERFVYTLPFSNWVGGKSPMEFINVPIVERTWGLHELRRQTLAISSSPRVREEGKLVPYAGTSFTYEEFIKTQKFGRLGGLLWSIGLAVLFGSLMFIPPLRWIVRKLGPAPGTGPSDECVVHVTFHLRVLTLFLISGC